RRHARGKTRLAASRCGLWRWWPWRNHNPEVAARSTTCSMVSNDVVRFTCICVEPPIGIEPMTYALRGCSRALLAGSKLALASCSQVAAGGDRWLLTAVRGHLGDTRPGGSSPGCGVPPRACREDPAASAQDAGWWKNRGGEPIDAGSGAA